MEDRNMAPVSYYEGIKQVIYLSTGENSACQICEGSGQMNFEEAINHYIQEHGFRLLHVGTQTSHAGRGDLWNDTVATLGK